MYDLALNLKYRITTIAIWFIFQNTRTLVPFSSFPDSECIAGTIWKNIKNKRKRRLTKYRQHHPTAILPQLSSVSEIRPTDRFAVHKWMYFNHFRPCRFLYLTILPARFWPAHIRRPFDMKLVIRYGMVGGRAPNCLVYQDGRRTTVRFIDVHQTLVRTLGIGWAGRQSTHKRTRARVQRVTTIDVFKDRRVRL